jgi:diguanylate cyclase (GGDEF)-like protein
MHEADRPHPGSTDLLAKICDADNLPSLPAVALRVLQMTQDEDVSVNQLADVVGQDPALTAKILKLVNSPLFGVARRIVSLPQAMVVLGLRTVKVLTLSFSIVDSYGQRRVEWFDYKTYWRRSLTQGVAARLIAEEIAPEMRDEAFVAGLLGNLGILAMAQVIPTQYEEPYRRVGGKHTDLLQAEQAAFGFAHCDVARRLFEKWNLPKDICLSAGLHHAGRQEGMDESIGRLVDVVYLGACIADLFCDGASQEGLDELHRAAAERLNLDKRRLEKVLGGLALRVKESAALLSMDIGETVSYETLREQAVLQLANLSVKSEVDLVVANKREATSRQREKDLEKAASTDSLSGLGNRAAFDRYIEQAVQQGLKSRRPVGLIMCDLDHFKQVNDTYGHPIGDLVIAATGDLLRRFEGPDVFAARCGGEEFALVIFPCDYSRLVKLSQDVCDQFRRGSVVCQKGNVKFNASLGAASTEALTQVSAASLVTMADKFLYLAKKRGRARACVAAVPTAGAAPIQLDCGPHSIHNGCRLTTTLDAGEPSADRPGPAGTGLPVRGRPGPAPVPAGGPDPHIRSRQCRSRRHPLRTV